MITGSAQNGRGSRNPARVADPASVRRGHKAVAFCAPFVAADIRLPKTDDHIFRRKVRGFLRAKMMRPLTFLGIAVIGAALIYPTGADAGGPKSTARAAMDLFAEHCFSPYLTSAKAAKAFALTGATFEFYDLAPFSSAAPSTVIGRAATPGTDRRCELSFPGEYPDDAAQVALDALEAEGIRTPAALPAQFAQDRGATLLAARRLNPNRVAIVHVGTRPTAQGTETFMLVERLTPAASVTQPAKDP